MELRIRPACPQDAAALLKIYAPYVNETAVTFEYDVPSMPEFRGRIERTLAMYPYLVAQTDGEMMGYAYAGAFQPRAAYRWAAEISIYVRMDGRRMGVGRRLYAALEQALRAQGVVNLYACIASVSRLDDYLTRDSVAFHERMGYRLAGQFDACGYKFGRWYDMVWMEKHIGGHTAPQPPVRPFGDVRVEMEAVWNAQGDDGGQR